ncbi:MAG: NAD(P)/FAD-dependent oxidoreductase [Bacillota bacterium]
MENLKYDIGIIGCGPAGLSAALNASMRKKNFILLGTDFCSPKMHISPWIDNYLGEYHIPGRELREKFLNHIKKVGVEIINKRVNGVYSGDGEFLLQCGTEDVWAKTVIIASGVEYGGRIRGEDEYIGKGVSYCATCDGALFENKRVALLVYYREAFNEVKYLSEVCKEVILFPLYKGDIPEVPPNVIISKEEPLEIAGHDVVDQLITNKNTIAVDGVFLFREAVPPAQLVPGLETYEGFIKVNKNMETNIPGVFAAGDCTGRPFQLAKALGEGQVAALNAISYLDKG